MQGRNRSRLERTCIDDITAPDAHAVAVTDATNGRMRALFRRLRDPGALSGGSAADVLAPRTEHERPREVLIGFVEAALADFDPRYREIVVRADIEGKPGKQVAHELALAPRTYYRLRAVAMRALDRALEARLQRLDRAGDDESSADLNAALLDAVAAVDPARARAIFEQLGPAAAGDRPLTYLRLRVATGEVPSADEIERLEPAQRFSGRVWRARALESSGAFVAAESLVAALEASPSRDRPEHRTAVFELAMLRALQARRHGLAGAFAAAVDDLLARAGRVPALRTHAVVAYAQVAIHLAVDDWRERLERARDAVRAASHVSLLRYVTMVEGYLAYVHGDPELALYRSRITALEGANPVLALQAEALHARAALALGLPWRRPSWTSAVLRGSYFQAELDALGVYHALARDDRDEALRTAALVRAHPATPHAPCVVALLAAASAVLAGEPLATVRLPDELLTHADLRTLRAALSTKRSAPAAKP